MATPMRRQANKHLPVPRPPRQKSRRPRGVKKCCWEEGAPWSCWPSLRLAIPWIREALNTVSTDDAYVNGHVTFVAARVRGQVARVLVDDNNRVRRGDLLVELDKEPYRTAVAIKTAAVDTAQADLRAASATVRGIEAEARSRRWKLQHTMEDVANQIAELRARVAGIEKSKAALTLAEGLEFERARQLVATDNIPRSEFDRRKRPW